MLFIGVQVLILYLFQVQTALHHCNIVTLYQGLATLQHCVKVLQHNTQVFSLLTFALPVLDSHYKVKLLLSFEEIFFVLVNFKLSSAVSTL